MAVAEGHREAFLVALVERDSAAARRAIEAAAAAPVALFDIYLDVIQPVLYEIGHRWAIGDLNVAQEHYATTIAQSLLDVLSARREPVAKDGRLALVTGTPEELHSLGSRMVADFLEADGWETILLGAGAPVTDIVELVEAEQPDVVALSTTTAGALPGVERLMSALACLEPRPLIVAGGQFWTAETSRAAAEFGADLVIHDVRTLADSLNERIPPHAHDS
jgi:methanogenic corrinoid protein MtbC1